MFRVSYMFSHTKSTVVISCWGYGRKSSTASLMSLTASVSDKFA